METPNSITIVDSKFFTEYPLYKRYKIIDTSEKNKHIAWPPINMFCPKCKQTNTFVGSQRCTNERSIHNTFDIAGCMSFLIYKCVSCNQFEQSYLTKIADDRSYIMKVGQHPAWFINVDDKFSYILGEYEETYKKGLICESQGYGIGANAYYRRIVERITDKLLNMIFDLMGEDENKDKYKLALDDIQKSQVASDKIKMVKDLLPKKLQPGNMNPLSILHKELSIGIHDLSDEDCLESAECIRNALAFILDQINRDAEEKEATKYFTENMKQILEKRNERLTS